MVTLTTLPPELLWPVVDLLELYDQVQLSSTCQFFRKFTAPRVFETVFFSNNTRIADSVYLATQKYGQYVTNITFYIVPPICGSSECYCFDAYHMAVLRQELEEGDDEDHEELLSGSSALLSAGKDLLPSLKSIVVEFPPVLEGHEGAYFLDPEPYQDVVSVTLNHIADMTLAALMKNTATSTVSIFNLPPHIPSFVHTEEWRSFLGRIEHFELSILGEKVAMWRSSIQDNYTDFLRRLDYYIFDHLVSVKSVSFHASVNGQIGHHGRGRAPLPFGTEAMPLLQELELANMAIDFRLVRFLQSRGGRPLSLTLLSPSAVSRGSPGDPPGIPWAEFFTSLVEVGNSISHFYMNPIYAEMRRYQETNFWEIENPTPTAESIAAYEQLVANPELRAFTYTYLDDKYGYVIEDVDVNIVAFRGGEDQRAYNRFIESVEDNKRRRSS